MKLMKMMKAVKKLKVWTKKKRNKLQSRTSTSMSTITTTTTTKTLIMSGSGTGTGTGTGDCCPLLPAHSAEIQAQTEPEITLSSSSTYWTTTSTLPSAPPLPPWLVLEHEYEYLEQEQRLNFAYPCPPQPCDEAIADLTTFQPKRSGGMIGCVVQFGIHVFRCFCPCFHVRDPHPLPKLRTD